VHWLTNEGKHIEKIAKALSITVLIAKGQLPFALVEHPSLTHSKIHGADDWMSTGRDFSKHDWRGGIEAHATDCEPHQCCERRSRE
jgi:hypothetical protein